MENSMKTIKFKIDTKIKGQKKYRNYGSINWNYIIGQYIVDRFDQQESHQTPPQHHR